MNHIGRDHSRSSGPAEVNSEHVAQDWHRGFWNVPGEGDSTPSPGDLFQPVATHITKFFLKFRVNVFSSVAEVSSAPDRVSEKQRLSHLLKAELNTLALLVHPCIVEQVRMGLVLNAPSKSTTDFSKDCTQRLSHVSLQTSPHH